MLVHIGNAHENPVSYTRSDVRERKREREREREEVNRRCAEVIKHGLKIDGISRITALPPLTR